MTIDLLPLRNYQRETVDAVFKAHADGMRRPAVVLPTGSGKTVVFAHLAKEHLERHGTRVLVLVHRDELADQALAKLRAVAPHLAAGKVKAAADDVAADVVVASVQTVSRSSRLQRLVTSGGDHQVPPIGLVIHDECHHSVSPSWVRVSDAFPDAVHAGFTATLERGDGVGLGTVWDDVVATRSIRWMVSKGHLVQPSGVSVATGVDLDRVRRSGGDYQAGALGEALSAASVPERIAAAVREHAPQRRSIVFLPTVATAAETAARLNAGGTAAAVVSGDTPTGERASVYRRFASGELRAIVNCMVLTEGADFPMADCAVIARPTRSRSLYTQMVGRALRPFPGKTDALVLDLVGSSEANRLVTLIDLEEGLYPDRAPCRTCWRLPCACPCSGCGGTRPCAGCSPAAEPELSGTGRGFDLFAASKSMWLRTRLGVMFIPAGDSDVVLWPSADGEWSVAEVPRRGSWTRLHDSLPLESAMSWAEVEAEDRGEYIALRGASWRRRKAPPTEAQLDRCKRLRIDVPAGATKAHVSDLLSVDAASRRMDPWAAKLGVAG